MARNRYTPETIIRKLREAEVLQGQGFTAGVRSEGDAILDGRGLQVVEAGTGPPVQIGMNRIGDQQAAPYQHADDAPAEGAEQLDQLRIAGAAGAVEGHALATEGVGPIQKKQVQVEVEG